MRMSLGLAVGKRGSLSTTRLSSAGSGDQTSGSNMSQYTCLTRILEKQGGCSTYRLYDESQAEQPQGSCGCRPGASGLGTPYGNRDRRHSLDTGGWLSLCFRGRTTLYRHWMVILRESWRYGTADMLHSCERRLSGQDQRGAWTSCPQTADA